VSFVRPADDQTQGEVYAKVIESVVDMSRTDFEEGGVDLSTLDYLKSVRVPGPYVHRLSLHTPTSYTVQRHQKSPQKRTSDESIQ